LFTENLELRSLIKMTTTGFWETTRRILLILMALELAQLVPSCFAAQLPEELRVQLNAAMEDGTAWTIRGQVAWRSVWSRPSPRVASPVRFALARRLPASWLGSMIDGKSVIGLGPQRFPMAPRHACMYVLAARRTLAPIPGVMTNGLLGPGLEENEIDIPACFKGSRSELEGAANACGYVYGR
jgi:hypothetical protein